MDVAFSDETRKFLYFVIVCFVLSFSFLELTLRNIIDSLTTELLFLFFFSIQTDVDTSFLSFSM
jgi:hypothetical protein